MRRILIALAVFGTLTAIHTWPLVTDPVHWQLNRTDPKLNAWIVAWVAHQIVTDPRHLFDANIFYPERNTLLFSEPLVPIGVLAVPVRAAGASAVFTYNIFLFLGFILTALGMYVLIYALTKDQWAGLLAGSLAAFNPHLLNRLGHLQALYMAGIPLSLWALSRLIDSKRMRDALALAFLIALTGWTSGYTAAFVVFAIVSAIVAQPRAWAGWQGFPVLWRLGVAAAVALILLLPILSAAADVRDAEGFLRRWETVERGSMRLTNYLASAGTIHEWLWSSRFSTGGERNFFPGAVSIGLAAFWLAHASAWRDRRTHVLLAVGATAFILALGTATPAYEPLYELLAPLQSIRAVRRFGYVVLLALGGLAALGLAALRAHRGGRSWTSVAAALFIAIANVETFVAPHPFVRFEPSSTVYRRLATSDAVGVVAEFPFYPPRGRRAEYQLASTGHWRPLLNGFSGFRPASHSEAEQELRDFPGGRSLALLRRRGVAHVVVHLQGYRRGRAELIRRRLARSAEFQLIEEDRNQTRLYRFVARESVD